jgi:hypothetical protein
VKLRFERVILVVLLALLAATGAARAGDGDLCTAAIHAAEAGAAVPRDLLAAVAMSESGRYDAERRRVAPWPWTVNSQGEGRYFATKAEAIAHVEALRRSGRRNIDVGCMQINLMYHPEAFDSLDEAFDPGRNVAYGAGFLTRLQGESRSWERAVERYHTADAERGRAYREKVYDRWQDVRLAAGPDPERPRSATLVASLRPPVFPSRRSPSTAGSGFLSLKPVAGRVAVLRPPANRPARPAVEAGGRLPGSALRIVSRRRPATFLPP